MRKQKQITLNINGNETILHIRRYETINIEGVKTWHHSFHGDWFPLLKSKKAVRKRIEFLKTIPAHIWDTPEYI